MASSSSSSSSGCSQKHDAFLSFRGEDTRAKFTSHLEARLRVKSIDTYIDNRLEKGEGISKALIEAIRSSKMSIIVFSVNFATSSWCLDEVVCIVECMRERRQVVVPVFYEVEPSNVRKQSVSYQTAFSKLKERFTIDKVNEWKAALTEVANISGFTSSEYRTDAELVEAIVNDIVKKLTGMSGSGHSKDLVGMENSVKGMKNLLRIDSSDVRVIGIWGMGGLGKTTLAHVIFDMLSSDFEARCFLEYVRENSNKLGLEKLKKKLFSELLLEKDLNHITSFHEERLCRKKVLIVLDDVDKPEQLDDLAGDHNWFGNGSRVIITTRDDQVLRDRVDGKYELQGLNDDCALELFNMYAFKRKPTSDDIDLSQRVVYHCKGIPLALKLLGSFFRSKSREYWDIIVEELKDAPHEGVQKVLKVSYDGLNEREQRVFLDIVYFIDVSKGTCRHYVECIFGGDRRLKREIDSLIDKSLIINDHNSLRMHDLISDMGLEIVRQQSAQEPGKRSRLRRVDDCYHVLQNNTGTGNIEGISLVDNEVADVSHANFKEMPRLRYLEIASSNLQLTEEPEYHRLCCNPKPIPNAMCTMQLNHQLEYLPSTLTYLEWCKWPFKSMPRDFSAHNLVELRMPCSKLQRLWSGDQKLGSLKHVDLSRSDALADVSSLSQAQNLESVNLSQCINLSEVPSLRFGGLDKKYHKCGNKKCSTLGHLNLQFCTGLKVISGISGCVKRLDLSYCCPFKELPPELIVRLTGLQELDLSYSKMLEHFPRSILKLKYLKHLSLRRCKISKIPIWIRGLSFLEVLDIAENPICEISSVVVDKLCKLRILEVGHCKNLKSLPELPLSLEHVGACGCVALRTVWSPIDELLQQEPWTDYYVTRIRRFLFRRCPLDRRSCSMLFKQFRLRVVRTAAAMALNSIKIDEFGSPDILVSFPGNYIPRWFTIRSKMHSFGFKPSPQRRANFLGFVVAFITETDASGPENATYNIRLTVVAKNNKMQPIGLCFKDTDRSRGCNVVLWYNYENYHDWRDAVEVVVSAECFGNGKVTACGLRLLYLMDYEMEFGKSPRLGYERIVFLP